MCAQGSRLHSIIARESDNDLQNALLLEDLISALRRDGVRISLDRARALVNLEAEPINPGEIALMNALELVNNIEMYIGRKWGIVLLLEISEHLSKNTEGHDYRPYQRKLTIADTALTDPDSALTEVLKLLKQEDIPGRDIHPIIIMLSVASIIWDLHPLPAWNGLFEFVIRQFFFEMIGLPLLRYIPMCSLCMIWEQGEITSPEVYAGWASLDKFCDEGFDSTNQFASFILLCSNSLGALERKLERKKSEITRTAALVDANDQLNFRQKALLLDLMSAAPKPVTIKEHQKRFGTVYSTARQDLLDLVDRGYLRMAKVKKALTFYKVPSLEKELTALE